MTGSFNLSNAETRCMASRTGIHQASIWGVYRREKRCTCFQSAFINTSICQRETRCIASLRVRRRLSRRQYQSRYLLYLKVFTF